MNKKHLKKKLKKAIRSYKNTHRLDREAKLMKKLEECQRDRCEE